MNATQATDRRCDKDGRAFAGSQKQIQFYVNEQPAILNQAIEQAFGEQLHACWVSPLAGERYSEYRDSRFLQALGYERLGPHLRDFWPAGGPRWDALARTGSDGTELLLVEAKSHIPELYGSGCKASQPAMQKIQVSLNATKLWLGVHPSANWNGSLYQSANRLAHLYFLNEIAGLKARLVNLYFIGDPHSPTTRVQWKRTLQLVKSELGVSEVPLAKDVFLPAY